MPALVLERAHRQPMKYNNLILRAKGEYV